MLASRTPSLEIHIPLSPNAAFLRMLLCAVASLREFGGRYRDARVVAMFSDEIDDRESVETLPWMRRLGIESQWVDRSRFAQDSYYATAVERFLLPFDADMVLMLDSDVLISGPLDGLVGSLWQSKEFGGVIAHVSPFENDVWASIFAATGIQQPTFTHEHTGWGYMFTDSSRRYCPPYFNLGVLCGPKEMMRTIGRDIYDLMHTVSNVKDTVFRCQAAVGLAVLKHSIPYQTLPMRYNFPNHMEIEALHGAELPHTSIIHILGRTQGLTKSAIYDSADGIEKTIARDDLKATNSLIQRVLKAIYPAIESDLKDLADFPLTSGHA